MRIAYCIHALHNCGGTEGVLVRKANYLAAVKGWEVFIITAHQHGRANAFAVDPAVKLIDLDRNDSSPLWRTGYIPALDHCLKAIRPDIAIAVNGKAMYAFPHCTDGSRKVAEFHFPREKYILKYGKKPLGMKYAEFRTRQVARTAARMDAFVVLTRKDLEAWLPEVPCAAQIYNPNIETGNAQSQLSNKVMVAAGRLSFEKNYPDMLEVWARVIEKHPDWTLKIYGDGPERASLETMVAQRFKDANVRLMRHTDNVPAALMESSGLLLTSRYEGLSLILVEASSLGVPPISYDCPKGPAEIIEDGTNGYLVRQGDVEEMARKICMLIESEELRREMGAQAKINSERFSIAAIMNQWEELFNELILR